MANSGTGNTSRRVIRSNGRAQHTGRARVTRSRTTKGAMAELFPMFLKLEGRPCLVVGGGRVAESKIESLVRCGARVRVIAPAATDTVRESAKAGKIEWEPRAFSLSDLTGVFLVVAATSSQVRHEQIFQQARRAGILCNVVDEPARCDFYYPAVVRRGPLQIAVSTSGRSPALAQRLRQELERHFDADYGVWTEEIGRARSALLRHKISPEKRKQLLRRISSQRAFDQFRQSAKLVRAEKDQA